MKAFGYTKSDLEAELPVELREFTLILSNSEIELLIAFLQNSKRQFETSSPTPGQSHLHLRDWWKEWTGSKPDFVVVYGESEIP